MKFNLRIRVCESPEHRTHGNRPDLLKYLPKRSPSSSGASTLARNMSNEQQHGTLSSLSQFAAIFRNQRSLGLSCLAVICGLLTVGLWPFNFLPKNRVQWLEGHNGIRFIWNGIAYTERLADFSSPSQSAKPPKITIEIWLQPVNQGKRREGEFFSIYNPAQQFNFGLRQQGSSLAVYGWFNHGNAAPAPERLILPKVFREGDTSLLTMTSGDAGTTIYVNGSPAKTYPNHRLATQSLLGQVILGHSPVSYEPWDGNMFGLCVCGTAFDPASVYTRYLRSMSGNSLIPCAEARTLAFYSFSEKGSEVITDRSGSHLDLRIPKEFHYLKRKVLESSWSQFSSLWSRISDDAINITGFVPLGALLYAFLLCSGKRSRLLSMLATLILGTFLSLGIELLQVYLPSRDSSSEDVINNILGTALGVVIVHLFSVLGRTGRC